MLCPCCSQKSYEMCCQKFHDGELPETALQLMRSRYTAYALDLPLYIIKTTHRDNAQYSTDQKRWAEEIRFFSRTTQFKRLDILGFEENGESATVTFIAHLMQNGQDVPLKEKSLFKKEKGRWLYLYPIS